MTENKMDKRFKTGLHSPFKYKLNTEFQDQKDSEWDTHLQKEIRTSIKADFKFLKDYHVSMKVTWKGRFLFNITRKFLTK